MAVYFRVSNCRVMTPRDPSQPDNTDPSDSRAEPEGSSSEHSFYTPVQIGPYVLC